MKLFSFTSRCVSLAVILGLAAFNANAADPAAGKDGMAAFAYKPPSRGAPVARVGGGTRGTAGQDDLLQVLAPDHAGLTTKEQPVLYWYTSKPDAAVVEFTLIDDEAIDPLLEIEAGNSGVAGLQMLDLKEHNISLAPGVAYQWSVAQVEDEGSRSMDLFTSGVIKHVEPDTALSNQIKGSTGTELVAIYASEGFWYDALAAINRQIKASPGDQNLTAIRDSLLEQVGLQEVAARH
jgi:hypothetical protein